MAMMLVMSPGDTITNYCRIQIQSISDLGTAGDRRLGLRVRQEQ